jgi:asparagine synthase (glutamine-hydrolysing)
LLADTKTLLSHWDMRASIRENLDRLHRENVFGKASRLRVKNILAIFKQRYLREESVTRALVALVNYRFPPASLDRLLYFHSAKADRLLFDIVTELLLPLHARGIVDIEMTEVESRKHPEVWFAGCRTSELPIYETFHAWQGEGTHLGRSAFFIRTFGCPVHCPWCDSAGTWHPDYIPDKVDRLSVDLLVEATRIRLRADVPVGAFLSGGLDSSSVVAFARDATAESLRCFTIGFTDDVARKEGMAADLPHARRVAEHLGVRLDTVWVGPEMVEELGRMLFHLDEPQADPAPINALFIASLARQHGIKVLLSGAGGDDVFTGYRRHHALVEEPWWAWLPPAARRGLKTASQQVPPTTELGRRIGKAFRYADLSGDERIAAYFHWIEPGRLRPLYGPRMLPEGWGPDHDLVLDAVTKLSASIPPLHRMLHLEQMFFTADHNLNYVDKVSMACGVEVRVPFLDPELVTLAARLPPYVKQHGRTGKWVLRRAMEPYVPREVIERKKTGFGAPLREWLRHELAPVVDDALSPATLTRRGLFDPDGVKQLVQQDRERRVDATYTIFSMICIELWCRMFIDPPTPSVGRA